MLPISVKMAMTHRMIRISSRFSRFSLDDRPTDRVVIAHQSDQVNCFLCIVTVSVWSTFRYARNVAAVLKSDKVPVGIIEINPFINE